MFPVTVYTSQLLFVGIVGILIVYTLSKLYLHYRAETTHKILDELNSISLPLIVLGLYLLGTDIYSQMAYSSPTYYGIGFYAVNALFPLVLIMAGLAAYRENASYLEHVSFLALIGGVISVYYGLAAFLSSTYTVSSSVMFVMYVFFGLAGVLSYPASEIVEHLTSPSKKKVTFNRHLVMVFLWFFVFVGSLLALYLWTTTLPFVSY
jgi:putative membrane protein